MNNVASNFTPKVWRLVVLVPLHSPTLSGRLHSTLPRCASQIRQEIFVRRQSEAQPMRKPASTLKTLKNIDPGRLTERQSRCVAETDHCGMPSLAPFTLALRAFDDVSALRAQTALARILSARKLWIHYLWMVSSSLMMGSCVCQRATM